ncbi:uncharacterized protein LOC129249159 [Anastrepha obliqua]|uniref:uncharacterized protein LOC129249159 n=1 Tax=Anastrepha obliqua TaxID=95512 RepID=UPI00240A5C29|nr:uncharacterized protein LOC129249159 [Anastrepha obliqua]
MSYLLTEIALEMLGYKFYDIDGKFGPTSFQQIGIVQQSQSNEFSGELLQTIIGFETENLNGNISTESNRESTVEGVQYCNDLDIPEKKSGHTRTFSAGLKKLLDLEYERLRSQVEQTVHRDTESFIDKNGGIPMEGAMQDILKTFMLREKDKLEKEAQTLQCFRKLVEKSTFKMDQDVYNQYKKVFVASNKTKSACVD